VFDFLDVTNLQNQDNPYMGKMILQWQDKNHITQEWTHREAGKQTTKIFKLIREQKMREHDISCTMMSQITASSHVDTDCTLLGAIRRQKAFAENHCMCDVCNCK
jgi:hypothetical protein